MTTVYQSTFAGHLSGVMATLGVATVPVKSSYCDLEYSSDEGVRKPLEPVLLWPKKFKVHNVVGGKEPVFLSAGQTPRVMLDELIAARKVELAVSQDVGEAKGSKRKLRSLLEREQGAVIETTMAGDMKASDVHLLASAMLASGIGGRNAYTKIFVWSVELAEAGLARLKDPPMLMGAAAAEHFAELCTHTDNSFHYIPEAEEKLTRFKAMAVRLWLKMADAATPFEFFFQRFCVNRALWLSWGIDGLHADTLEASTRYYFPGRDHKVLKANECLRLASALLEREEVDQKTWGRVEGPLRSAGHVFYGSMETRPLALKLFTLACAAEAFSNGVKSY